MKVRLFNKKSVFQLKKNTFRGLIPLEGEINLQIPGEIATTYKTLPVS